ncbi:MAG: NosD domain-containing protein [Candidatus Hodarchaeota archaeon]
MISKNKKKIILTVAILSIAMILANILQAGTVSIAPLKTKNLSSDDIDEETYQAPDNDDEIETVRTAGIIESPIYIDNNTENNWDWAKDQGLCSGSGTDIDPYVIEDLIIDGGGSGSCILIENSNAHFRIENCTVYNSGSDLYDAGIRLHNSINGKIINNDCSQNANGICLEDGSSFNTLKNNFIVENYYGISIWTSSENNITTNTFSNNDYGILILGSSSYNTFYLNSFYLSFYFHVLYFFCPGTGDSWDNGIFGNYWDDYIGIDEDDDGIGDTPYNKNSVIDNYPIWDDGYDGTPIHIYDNPYNTWEWVSTLSWCSGDGTEDEPYVIQDLIIDAGGLGSCILIENSDAYFRIENCTVYNSGSGYAGIKLYSTTNGEIIDNECSLNSYGIYLMSSDNNTISGNIANNNFYRGIYLSYSDSNTISGNTANDNDYWGIYLYFSESNTISGNIANDNFYRGMFLYFSDSNTISGNIVNNNDHAGIVLLESNDNIVIKNTFFNNFYSIYISGTSSDNVFYLNSFYGSLVKHVRYGVYSGTGNSWDNGIAGNYWNDYKEIYPNATNNGNIWDISYEIYEAVSEYDNYPLVHPYISSIYIDDDAENNWEWSRNQYWCSGSGTYTDPYVIKDLIIDADVPGYGLYIRDSDAYFRIENCTVCNSGRWAVGIKLVNTNNGKIINNNCSLNNYGIFLSNSDNNTISGNTVNNNDYGIRFVESNNNTVSGNTVNYNNQYGIYISSNNAVNPCRYNTISENNFSNNIKYGIYLYFSDNNTISGNIANNNGDDGIMLYSSNFNDVSFNNASFNGDDGIHLTKTSQYNSIYNNNAFNNSLYGICLTYASHNNTIENNILVDNHNHGLCIYTLCKDNIDINNIEYRTYEPDPGISEAYALLIGGSANPSAPYWLKPIIIDKFKMKQENIFTLKTDADHNQIGNLTKEIVYEAFDNISKLIDSNDIFFFFIYEHGGTSGNLLMSYFSYNHEDGSLQESLDKIYCAEQYVFIHSCHSGGYNDEIPPSLSSENRFLISPCKVDQLCWKGIGQFIEAFETSVENFFQNGDYNQDGFVDFNEAFNYMVEIINKSDPVLSDGIYNTINNPVDGIRPVIANVSEKYSEGNTRIELNFTIDGIGYVKSINVWLGKLNEFNNLGELIENISVPVIYDNNGGQGRYYLSHTTSQVINTYFIHVKYEYSARNTVYNRFIDNDNNDIPDCMEIFDTDGDRLSDGFEIYISETDPLDKNDPFFLIPPGSDMSFIYHDPILISSNDDFTPENGVIGGSGSQQDPYIIQGWIFKGDGLTDQISIQDTDKYFIIQFCIIINSGTSNIIMDNVSNGILINNFISNSNRGIVISNSNTIIILANIIKNNEYGIYLNNSHYNLIWGNTATNNDYGIYLWLSDDNTILGNTINDNTEYGIFLEDNCRNNTIKGNTANNNDYGIYLANNDNNIITGNKAYHNRNGIYLSNSHYNFISENTASDNNNGIILEHSDNNTISGNTANYNRVAGIYLEESGYNIISRNTANYNGWIGGILLWDSNNNNLSGNIINNNDYGIYLINSDKNILSRNTANSNVYEGIYLEFSNNGKISGNTANENDWDGICLWYSNNNSVSGNTANYNSFNGIYLMGSDNNISRNIINNNTEYGIDLYGGNNNLFYQNYFINNGFHAQDGGISTRWDNGTIGNYWDDYSGVDEDDDNIGDAPYNKNSVIDNYPIYRYHKSPIYIDDSAENNWEWAKKQIWCSGSGTLTDPYVIKDLIINGGGSAKGSCISIKNSDAYFRIENCKVYNSGFQGIDAGIILINTNNGEITNNDVSENWFGITLWNSDGNFVNHNNLDENFIGIIIRDYSSGNTITENTFSDHQGGILIAVPMGDNEIHSNLFYGSRSWDFLYV